MVNSLFMYGTISHDKTFYSTAHRTLTSNSEQDKCDINNARDYSRTKWLLSQWYISWWKQMPQYLLLVGIRYWLWEEKTILLIFFIRDSITYFENIFKN